MSKSSKRRRRGRRSHSDGMHADVHDLPIRRELLPIDNALYADTHITSLTIDIFEVHASEDVGSLDINSILTGPNAFATVPFFRIHTNTYRSSFEHTFLRSEYGYVREHRANDFLQATTMASLMHHLFVMSAVNAVYYDGGELIVSLNELYIDPLHAVALGIDLEDKHCGFLPLDGKVSKSGDGMPIAMRLSPQLMALSNALTAYGPCVEYTPLLHVTRHQSPDSDTHFAVRATPSMKQRVSETMVYEPPSKNFLADTVGDIVMDYYGDFMMQLITDNPSFESDVFMTEMPRVTVITPDVWLDWLG